MNYVTLVFSGVFLCNCIPHLNAGLQGVPFPTPFATPRGVGESSPLLNVIWGFFNLAVGLLLLERHPTTLEPGWGMLALFAGGLAIGIYLATHFGKVRRSRRPH